MFNSDEKRPKRRFGTMEPKSRSSSSYSVFNLPDPDEDALPPRMEMKFKKSTMRLKKSNKKSTSIDNIETIKKTSEVKSTRKSVSGAAKKKLSSETTRRKIAPSIVYHPSDDESSTFTGTTGSNSQSSELAATQSDRVEGPPLKRRATATNSVLAAVSEYLEEGEQSDEEGEIRFPASSTSASAAAAMVLTDTLEQDWSFNLPPSPMRSASPALKSSPSSGVGDAVTAAEALTSLMHTSVSLAERQVRSTKPERRPPLGTLNRNIPTEQQQEAVQVNKVKTSAIARRSLPALSIPKVSTPTDSIEDIDSDDSPRAGPGQPPASSLALDVSTTRRTTTAPVSIPRAPVGMRFKALIGKRNRG